ncbi:MAG: chorismate mutase [Thermodesulfobacteriota bacterium]|nr:chorismate mutase [Thermodesulfobacteriota bacterium]
MDRMEEFRESINKIDKQIIELLGRRFGVCRNVAEYKKANNIPMMQPSRVTEVKEKCSTLAVANSVDPTFIRKLYEFIIKEACRIEDIIIDEA